MRKICVVICFIFVSTSVSSMDQAPAKTTVIHLMQTRQLPDGDLDNFVEATSSQFYIARSLKQYSRYPIVSETAIVDLNTDSKNIANICLHARRLFPSGIPEKLWQLSDMQEAFLYAFGGDRTSLCIGDVSTLRRHISGKKHQLLLEEEYKSPDNFETIVKDLRDAELMKRVEKIARLEGATVIVVILGADHDLKPYCDKYGFTYEPVATQIAPEEHYRKALKLLGIDMSNQIFRPRLVVRERPQNHGPQFADASFSSFPKKTSKAKRFESILDQAFFAYRIANGVDDDLYGPVEHPESDNTVEHHGVDNDLHAPGTPDEEARARKAFQISEIMRRLSETGIGGNAPYVGMTMSTRR